MPSSLSGRSAVIWAAEVAWSARRRDLAGNAPAARCSSGAAASSAGVERRRRVALRRDGLSDVASSIQKRRRCQGRTAAGRCGPSGRAGGSPPRARGRRARRATPADVQLARLPAERREQRQPPRGRGVEQAGLDRRGQDRVWAQLREGVEALREQPLDDPGEEHRRPQVAAPSRRRRDRCRRSAARSLSRPSGSSREGAIPDSAAARSPSSGSICGLCEATSILTRRQKIRAPLISSSTSSSAARIAREERCRRGSL